MAKRRRSLTDSVRSAMLRSDMTGYRLSQLTGIDKATLSRFSRGAGVSSVTLDLIADELGLIITKRRSSTRQKGTNA